MRSIFLISPAVTDLVRKRTQVAICSSFVKRSAEYVIVEIPPGCDIVDFTAAQNLGDYTRVIAVGGDGTLSAVANTLSGSNTLLGVIPAGTGNLVARELGIPLDVEMAVEAIAECKRSIRIDALQINERIFLLNAGVGVNAEVIDHTSRIGKSLFGRSAYVGRAVWEVLNAKPQRFEVTIDEQSYIFQATDISIYNCGMLARTLNPGATNVHPNDGHADASIFCMKTPFEYPWYYLLKLFAPRHENKIMHEIPVHHAIAIQSEQPTVVQADGDIIGHTPVVIKIIPSAVEIILPA